MQGSLPMGTGHDGYQDGSGCYGTEPNVVSLYQGPRPQPGMGTPRGTPNYGGAGAAFVVVGLSRVATASLIAPWRLARPCAPSAPSSGANAREVLQTSRTTWASHREANQIAALPRRWGVRLFVWLAMAMGTSSCERAKPSARRPPESH